MNRSATAFVAAALAVVGVLPSAVTASATGLGAETNTFPSDDLTEIGVVVQATTGNIGQAKNSFVALGGDITRVLPVIDGFSGTIAQSRLDDLTATSSIAAVSPDADVTPMAVDPTLGYDPASTTSMSAITQITGAQTMWNTGFTGKGIDVAVIDTGVAKVAGLNQTGKVIDGPDLSLDNIEPTLRYTDSFGHGTHMAGIIAGSDVAPGTSANGCTTCLGKSPYTNTTKFVGIAPEARIINVKVGAYDGATDVSQVIAAIDWVVQHRNDPGINIRVLNLSFGTDSTQPASLDPLVHAVEQAWKAGIVVVAAAGNDGLMTPNLANPAMSPMVIAVGASDPKNTLTSLDDVVPSFAQHGNSTRGVDVIAPGVSVISLRVPGGFVDQNVTTGKLGTRFQQASGTSQSTAIVSGLAALLVSKYPTATPDQIKAYLKTTAQPVVLIETAKKTADGQLQFATAVNTWYSGSGSARLDANTKLPTATPQTSTATGLGTLEAARGTYHLTNGTTTLTGEIDIFGNKWNPNTMATLTTTRTTWNGGTWNGARWTGDTWTAARWTSIDWTNNDWTGARWTGARWTSMIWDGARWTGARWTGARWSAGTWTGARWTGARWSDSSWS